MSAINLKPEAVELLNQMCDVDELESRIAVLDDAEEKLQDMAFQCGADNRDAEGLNLYDIAYTLKRYKKELIELKRILGNGEDNQDRPG